MGVKETQNRKRGEKKRVQSCQRDRGGEEVLELERRENKLELHQV